MEGFTCAIDWQGTMSFIKDLVVSCAAVFAAFVAYKGINEWRAEESGKADFELARRIGKAVFQLRDLLADARRPLIMGYEFPEAYDSSDKESQADAYAHLFNSRFLPVRDCVIEIQSLRNEAEALWGKDIVVRFRVMLSRDGSGV